MRQTGSEKGKKQYKKELEELYEERMQFDTYLQSPATPEHEQMMSFLIDTICEMLGESYPFNGFNRNKIIERVWQQYDEVEE